nr:HAMP domain-containing sensor histidine kinase [Cohnella sp. WQ 127256]
MLVVPFVLIILTVMVIFHFVAKNDNPIKKFIEQDESTYNDIKLMSLREPESLLKSSVATELDKRLSKFNKQLIIRIDDELVYTSAQLSSSNMLTELPAFGSSDDTDDIFRGKHAIIRHEDFILPDKREGSVFVVMDNNPFLDVGEQNYIWFAVVVLVILALTNGVLTFMVSRSIIRPLKALQKATEEIKDGNLDYEVKPRSKDEIGKLSVAFEEMRLRLKETVELQIQYEESRKELISNISHDLKTPVTAIKGYVEGIMDGVTNSPDKLDRYVKTIFTKAMDMDRMIDELFLISKLDLGKMPFHFEQVDMGAYLQDCAQELYFDMEKRGIKLKLDALPEEEILIKADREKLKRVLINIIENAMKYMDKTDGKISLSIHAKDSKAVIRVRDNGQGIAEDALPHIFDRFYRADPSRNSTTGGSGLGLSIAKQIVEEHGGQVWAESELSKGTTIYVELPVWMKR